MPALRRLVLGLNAATVLLVAGGILLLVLPSRIPPVAPPATVMASSGALTDSATLLPPSDPSVAERVVRSDIFSQRRSPPSRRFALGESESDPGEVPPDVPAAVPNAIETTDSTGASVADDVVPHLYGTMLGSGGGTALMRLDTSASEPRLYRVGEGAGGYRVLEVSDRAVTLAGPGGRMVLRLQHPDE